MPKPISNKVSNGTDAMMAFESLMNEKDKNKINEIRENLIDYCELDTLATLESLRAIRNMNLTNE